MLFPLTICYFMLREDYFVDTRYANQPCLIAPYQRENYHRSHFGEQTRYHGYRELFNHGHSSIQNVLEHFFGALRRLFCF